MRKALNLRLFGLDAAQVAYYRAMLDCLPRPDEAEVRRRVAELRSIAERIDTLVQEFNERTSKLAQLGIGRAPGAVSWMYYAVDEREEWRSPLESVHYKTSREEWTVRPTKAQALEAWNRLVVALGQQPIRIYRTGPKRLNQWAAEFRRKDGSPMFVPLEDLVGRRRQPPMVGWLGSLSLISIIDGMSAWLDGHRADQCPEPPLAG